MPTALSIVKRFFPEVETVEDADESAYVEVVPEDSSADRKNHKACALAVACKRMFEMDGVIVSKTMAYLVKGSFALRYRLSQDASNSVVAFDQKGVFAPGMYQLARPFKGHRLGEHSDKKIPEKSHKRHHRIHRHLTDGIREVLGSAYGKSE
jgi:hypothetical protein